MSYFTMREDLINVFNQNNFENAWREGEINRLPNGMNPKTNTLTCNYQNDYNLDIVINYPGYKTNINNRGNIVYDYRVSLNNIAISHVNIIVDLYNKSVQSNTARELLSRLLRELAIEGDEINIQKYLLLNNLDFATPSQNLLNYVNEIHIRLGKTYNRPGNSNWNYTLEELCTLIPNIVLQEDLNYPMPYYQGRRMSFYRYLEALYCAAQNAEHNLGEVISRALSHGRPLLWNCINYEDISNINM